MAPIALYCIALTHETSGRMTNLAKIFEIFLAPHGRAVTYGGAESPLL